MNGMILAGLPGDFDRLAVRAAMGEDVEAELTTLVARVARVRKAAGTDAGRRQGVEKVRGQLRLRQCMLGTPEPALPNEMDDRRNKRQRASYADAIAHLTALVEGE